MTRQYKTRRAGELKRPASYIRQGTEEELRQLGRSYLGNPLYPSRRSNVCLLSKKPVDFFRADPGNPRKSFPDEELRELGESLRKKQFVPLIARKKTGPLWTGSAAGGRLGS